MSDKTPTQPTPDPGWRLAVNAGGTPLYWVSADGTFRHPSDPPPRSEWNAEMCCGGCPDPRTCIEYGALCSG